MGEAADMILEGIVCESCFMVIDETASGYPRKCKACEEQEEIESSQQKGHADEEEGMKKKRKRYCPCGHAEKSHYFCECPFCGAEHCDEGCECETKEKGHADGKK